MRYRNFRKLTATIAATVLFVCYSTSAIAQINIDGVLDGTYGSAFAVQTTQTGFGNSMGGTGGSELDAAYAHYDGMGNLSVMLTGNLEANFNKLDIFFDSRAGGENTLSGAPDYDFDNGGTWISSGLNGLTFDSGFTADYHMFARGGGSSFEIDLVDRLGGAGSAVLGNFGSVAANNNTTSMMGVVQSGTNGIATNGANVSTFLNHDILFAIDNSNDGGVAGGASAADQAAAAAVTTGYEFQLNVEDLGIDPTVGGTVLISAMINGGNHDFLSNQVLGGIEPQGNLGGDGSGGFIGDLSGVNFTLIDGNQFITIEIPPKTVPEPGTAGLVVLAAMAALSRRRRG